MRGKIKFVDQKTGQYGFIVRDDTGTDVHFSIRSFLSESPWAADQGAIVDFEVRDAARPFAVGLQMVKYEGPSFVEVPSNEPGETFPRWGAVPSHSFIHRDGQKYSSVYELLAKIALKERWYFGAEEPPDDAARHRILRNYLTYTFHRLYETRRVIFQRVEGHESDSWAAFNTGLVDALYDPIYALFVRNAYAQRPPWRFYDFCVPGKGVSGKQLTSVFDPLPEAAKYFDSNFEMVLDTDRDIHVDYEHVIRDGIARGRFPIEFLRQNLPRNFVWEDYSVMPAQAQAQVLKKLSDSVLEDVRCTRAIKNRLEDAKALAEKRTKWNFKTAIPQYHPRFNTMSLLLPLALLDDEVVDIALVVTKNPSGSYQGRTVLPLHWAYQNARVVCRPDSDWLTPDHVGSAPVSEDDDQDTAG